MLGYRWVSWEKNVQRRGREENQSQARWLGDCLVEKERDPSIWKDQEGGRRHLREVKVGGNSKAVPTPKAVLNEVPGNCSPGKYCPEDCTALWAPPLCE